MKKKVKPCWCGGWWFPHRPGCKNCEKEDWLKRSLRDSGMDIVSNNPPKGSKKIPF